MMGRSTTFDADQARWELLKECQHIAPPELTAKQDFALGIDAVNLENRRSVAPATPPLGAASLQTTSAVVDHGQRRKTQKGTRMSGLEPRRGQSPQWHPHGCA